MTETIIDQIQIRQERATRNQRLYELGLLALGDRQLQEINQTAAQRAEPLILQAVERIPDGNPVAV
jgi:hypothetical protein